VTNIDVVTTDNTVAADDPWAPSWEVPPDTAVWFDDDLGVWMIAGYAEARTALESELFGPGIYSAVKPDIPRATDIFLVDDDTHHRCRVAMGRAMSKPRVGALADSLLRPAARECSAAVTPGDGINLENSYITPYYRRAIFGAVGISEREGDEIVTYLGVAHSYFVKEGPTSVRGHAAIRLLNEFAVDVVEATPASERIEAGLTGFLRSEAAAKYLGGDEVVSLILSFFETLVKKVSIDLTATLLRLVLALPESEQARLRGEPEVYVAAAGEAARMQRRGSVPRQALKDVALGGQMIRAGQAVLVLIGEADRNRQVFPDADRFDPWRAQRDEHLGFGAGKHRCIGRNLGKMIAAVGCHGLHQRFDAVPTRSRFDLTDVRLVLRT
jgi:cytochrome P450